MYFYQIAIYIFAILTLIIGLLLSNAGSTGGLAALSGHDLELFKKTKDYGLVKILRIVMFIMIFLLIIFSILHGKK
ncbi:preprotein translocase subunit SecG [Candidatus Mycoplasma haematobovis]|uniref:Preprotein translocase subunit SecG n=1 Tax=Candidatus Mycoplasma haematobovis TaxID=432608 RepID=A0A1A9QDZ2_9MOLU|nr:preprotein translocase subunit SecG [Candidatus Mycoplasma haematobovis]OAL10344.1 preprotein translocase subunit SecG [Candidatus Mycoplasma haematobovis]